MIKEEYKYSDITEKIIGCAMRVHQRMRNGYPEKIYHNCMIIEYKRTDVNFESEVWLPVYYEGVKVGTRRIDYLVEKKVVVEIKAVAELTDAHLAQALNYLEGLNLEVGLLINFGAKSLQIKRIINNKVK